MSTSDRDPGSHTARIVSVVFWIAVWALLALYVGNDILLAGPWATLLALFDMLGSGSFWAAVALSGSRIIIASVLSACAGIVLGICAAKWRPIEALLEIPVQIMKSAPVACVVVILLVVFGAAGAVVIIVAFVAFPPFYLASLRAFHIERSEQVRMFELMGLSKAQLFFACTWPAMLPFYQHAAKTAVALSWRAGITGELLSIPLASIGSAIYVSKLTLDTPALLAWTAIIMVLALLCELIVDWVLELTAFSPRLAVRMRRGGARSAEGESPRSLSQHVLLRSVGKSFDGAEVLDGVDLDLGPGDRICLMAPTGTGKSTLIKVLLGFEPVDTGSVEKPLFCGVVQQHPSLISRLSAFDNVLLVSDPSQYTVPEIEDHLMGLLPKGALDKRASELSGGTKRLVEIARALFSPGECIVMDEPFTGLDAGSKERACSFIMAVLRDRPLIVATHDEDDARLLQARVLAL